jgi:TATA-binding protein-associated factor
MLLFCLSHSFLLTNVFTGCCTVVWEVRHGSIMALREILTHQGAFAGVYFPDPSLPSSDLDDKTKFDSLKRPHGININEGVDVEHIEPVSKRHKKEPNPSETMFMDYDKELVNGDCSKTEVGLSIMSTVSGGKLNSAHIKVVEQESHVDSSFYPCKGDTTCAPLHEKLNSISNPSSLIHAQESSKFSKLVQLANYSYMKNWEFLQDCAIRFLCVLSLDRYVFLDLHIDPSAILGLISSFVMFLALVIMYRIKWLPLFVKLVLKLLVL